MQETDQTISPARQPFQPGDKVVLAQGPYQGSYGIVLRTIEDANWLEIQEWDGRTRSHPVVWLRRRT